MKWRLRQLRPCRKSCVPDRRKGRKRQGISATSGEAPVLAFSAVSDRTDVPCRRDNKFRLRTLLQCWQSVWELQPCWSKMMPDPFASVTANAASHPTLDSRSEEHTSELQSRLHLVCRLLL